MGSTSSKLLELCLHGEDWLQDLLDRAIAEPDFLSVVIEGLNDRFEPRLVEVYERLFTQVIRKIAPELRLRRRTQAEPPKTIDRVYILSRVTLGADVAVTSVMLDAMKKRYPEAKIIFVGPRKSYELFQADPRIEHMDAPYARNGSLVERLRASGRLWFDDGIVIDPDSRLTQLGLISVCDESRYFWFQSRSLPGGRLPDIAADWVRLVFSVEARPYVAPIPAAGPAAEVTISLGVGENEAKRIPGDFECRLLQIFGGRSVLVDKGGTPDERARVEQAIPQGMRSHDGSFASFAAEIMRSKLYIGYDSAGGHVASACGVPAICIFKGAVNERFLERWKPLGTVLRGDESEILAYIKDRC